MFEMDESNFMKKRYRDVSRAGSNPSSQDPEVWANVNSVRSKIPGFSAKDLKTKPVFFYPFTTHFTFPENNCGSRFLMLRNRYSSRRKRRAAVFGAWAYLLPPPPTLMRPPCSFDILKRH